MRIEKLQPAFQDYLWGGTKLRDLYNKNSDLPRLAESWELSAHPAGESRIMEGPDAGLPLSAYIERHGKGVLGANGAAFDSFPVLIKLIDAQLPLSVQVHPSDGYALRVEGEYGKTEMWYVMDCTPGAFLYFGLNRTISKEDFRQRIADNTVTEVLNRVEVRPGDVFFIESGTMHAIGGGILICEIQQNSNTTYRVYDYDRRDDAGNLRPLQIDKALDVSVLGPPRAPEQAARPTAIEGGTRLPLAACKYFTAVKYEVETAITLDVDETSFAAVTVLTGSCALLGPDNVIHCQAGDSVFIPAGTGCVTADGGCSFISTTV